MEKKEIKVSEIQITPVRPKYGLVAFASCVLNNALYLGDIAIIKRNDGSMKLAFPSKVLKDNNNEILFNDKGKPKRYNIYYPINKGVGTALEEAIIKEANKIIQ